MPGTWKEIAAPCNFSVPIFFLQCAEFGVSTTKVCLQWATTVFAECVSWASSVIKTCLQYATDTQQQCSQWADEGHSECSKWEQDCHWYTFWNCVIEWLCDGWYWVANVVCVAYTVIVTVLCVVFAFIVVVVCSLFLLVVALVCVLWFILVSLFCLLWIVVLSPVSWFCWNSANGGPMFLLTDGTVLMNECAGGFGTHQWWKLVPDSVGSYINGNWTRVADSITARKYFASAVLADGRLIVCGGEYSDASGSNSATPDDTANSEIYDPIADAWTALTPPPGITQIGDSACCLLSDGRFLLGSFNSQSVFIFDPATGNWNAAASKGASASEESWVLMDDGTIITVQCSNPNNAEKYVISADQWVSAGTLLARIIDNTTDAVPEIGPGILLTDGRVFFVGAGNGNTAIYTQGAQPADPGSWAAGPALPQSGKQNQGSKDGPGALLPSGIFLFPIAPVDDLTTNSQYLSPCSFFEFDGTNLNPSTNPSNSNCSTFVGRMMLLPTGQVVWAREDDSGLYAFTETGSPQDSFRPVITSAPSVVTPGSTIQVSGTQFNGLSQAVGYGDDYAAATNYPLVRIRNKKSGNVRYCRTFDHTTTNSAGNIVTSMGVATGSAIINTQVAIPADLETGESELFVVANGIPSEAFSVTIR
jgi:hypothetical protein